MQNYRHFLPKRDLRGVEVLEAISRDESCSTLANAGLYLSDFHWGEGGQSFDWL